MKTNFDEEKLTAYALGELPAGEAAAMEKAIAQSEEAQDLIAETREIAGLLRAEFQDDLERVMAKPRNILPLPERENFSPDAPWQSLGVAALLAICAVLTGVMFFGRGQPANSRAAKAMPDIQMEVESDAFATEPGANAQDGAAFISVAAQPISSVPLGLGTASYAEVRRALKAGVRPPREAVRIAEMVNYFAYEFPERSGEEEVSIAMEAASCPWNADHRLVRIGLKGRARDFSARVEFNPSRASAYRLVGCEKGGIRKAEDATREMRVTVLYEVVPVSAAEVGELLVLQLEKKDAQRVSERALVDQGLAFAQASDDFRFAAAVAEVGMFLQDPAQAKGVKLERIIAQAEASRGRDEGGARAEFIQLLRRAEALAL